MKKFPAVTVIMPVRNEGAFIARSLGAVLRQDYPSDHIEIIVSDGMSTDGTRDLVRSLQNDYPGLRLIDNPGKIAPTALNTALALAKGEIIVRVDGHCEIAPDYVRNCVEHLLRGEVDGVGGPLETVGETYIAQVISAAMSSSFGVGGSAFRTVKDKTVLTDTVAFPAYTRRIIERAGLYDEELVRNQDDEYNYRLRKLGAKILLASDVKSRYYSRSSLRSLWRQYFQYGYWKVRVMQKHPRQMQPRQFVPALFVSALLVGQCLALLSPIGTWVLGTGVGAYATANLAASLLTSRRAGWRLLPLLPVAFAILHLAYGLGFITGLVRFRHLWGKDKMSECTGSQISSVKQV
jgi:hypothetical protein